MFIEVRQYHHQDDVDVLQHLPLPSTNQIAHYLIITHWLGSLRI
ncbi:hypothetical protein CYCME_1043 [Cycloclasticus zancles 78-ME]|uniref:Uncharacterized protein n=1 Tax=Cycloclasticus zancles 78-ME TaxID=1198232 RepID=S5TW46_9GAMM|nr:hypothetical protein CYCME_1043 [Cycloclasticus zancles 78-ME]